MNTKKQKENNKSKSKEIKNNKIDEKVFARIKTKFREYCKVLFWLIAAYITVYLVWFFTADKLARHLNSTNDRSESLWTKNSLFLALVVIIVQGIFFSLDGWVTSLLKSPFNQMCYAINMAKEIDDKKKDYIITKATESNEHCKETLKKFGILAISGELIRIFIQTDSLLDTKKYGKYAALFNISYLIPLTFAGLAIFSINRELKKIEKSLVVSRGKKA